MVSGARRTDFASRVEAVRGANNSLNPQQAGFWLVWQAGECRPAPCWGVVVPDADRHLVLLAEDGLTPDLHLSAWVAATQVVARSAEFTSGNDV